MFERIIGIVNFYLIVYVIGAIWVLYVLFSAIKSGKIRLKEEQAYDLALVTIIGTLLGARIFHVLFWGYDYYLKFPLEILDFSRGGFSFHGGLAGGLIAAFFYARAKKIALLPILDVVVIPTSLVLALGRVANFLNGEILGKISTSQICVFVKGFMGCRHPVALYAALGQVVLFFILNAIVRGDSREKKQGKIFFVFLFLSGVMRFLLDFLVDERTYAALTSGQWISLVLVAFSLVFYRYRNRAK